MHTVSKINYYIICCNAGYIFANPRFNNVVNSLPKADCPVLRACKRKSSQSEKFNRKNQKNP